MPSMRRKRTLRSPKHRKRTLRHKPNKSKTTLPLEKLESFIKNGDTKGALAIIKAGNYDPAYINRNGNTDLIQACRYKLPAVALALLETGTAKSDHVGYQKNTALMWACCSNIMHEVALKLLQTGHSKPNHVNEDGKTALYYAISTSMKYDFMFKLIAASKDTIGQVSKPKKETVLIKACQNNNPKVALKILETGKAKPEHIDKEMGMTALEWACTAASGDKQMEKVALKLIATKKARPEHITKENRNALSYACGANKNKVALKLLDLGTSNPGLISKSKTGGNNNALINACRNKMTKVAFKLLETGRSHPEHINKEGYSALYWANVNELPLTLREKIVEMTKKKKAKKNKSRKTRKNKTKRRK